MFPGFAQTPRGHIPGCLKPVAEMPLPDRVEIELDGEPGQPCIMYRYTQAGEFCGDTWHETFQAAFEQAEYEYGLSERDFRPADSMSYHEPGPRTPRSRSWLAITLSIS